MSSRLPRIGMVCYPSHGGSGIVATELGLALAGRGCEVHFVTYAPPVRLKGYVQNISFHQVFTDNYPVFHHPPYVMSLATKLVEIATEYHLDLVHAHYAIPHATCAFLAREMLGRDKLATVTTLHGTDITLVGVAPSFHTAVRFSIEQSDGVTAVSGWLRERTRELFMIEKPIEVIHNFIDTKRFRPAEEARRRWPFPCERKVLVHASNFRPVKNIPAVINVFERVRRAIDAHLVLIGDGPELSVAHDLVRTHGIHDRVSFMGIQDAMDEILVGADLLLLPSEHESFGLVALEAMASGVPVIATNQGGTRELIESGVSGYLADPHDVEGMARQAIEVLSSNERWTRMSAAARQRAVEDFDEDAVVDRYLAFYEAILRNRGR